MRVFLRERATGQYYRGLGRSGAGWVGALEFATVSAAARHAIAEQLSEVEIVLRCDYLDREVPLPVTPLWCDLEREDGLSLSSPLPVGDNSLLSAPTLSGSASMDTAASPSCESAQK